MYIEFKSALFGIDANYDPFNEEDGPLRLADRPKPTYNAETDTWSLECILGECGMEPKMREK